MKENLQSMNELGKQTPFKPITGQTFKFRCHKEITCFTKCCANLNSRLNTATNDIISLISL